MEIQFIPSDPKYAALFLEYRQDPVTRLFNPLMNQTLDELRVRLNEACSDWKLFDAKDSFFWFVSEEKQIVGTASLQNINRMMLTAEVGYGVFPGFRGKGLAVQIVNRLTTDAFCHTNLRKLIAFVHEKNAPSRRVLEKNGYVQEGLLREHYLVNGAPVNETVYGVLRREVI